MMALSGGRLLLKAYLTRFQTGPGLIGWLAESKIVLSGPYMSLNFLML